MSLQRISMRKDPANPETRIALFQRREVRRTIHNNEWWFVVEDVVLALIDSRDATQYIQRMKQRDPELKKGWVQIVHTVSEAFKGWRQIATSLELQFDAPGGPRTMLCANKADFTGYK